MKAPHAPSPWLGACNGLEWGEQKSSSYWCAAELGAYLQAGVICPSQGILKSPDGDQILFTQNCLAWLAGSGRHSLSFIVLARWKIMEKLRKSRARQFFRSFSAASGFSGETSPTLINEKSAGLGSACRVSVGLVD